MKYYYLISVVKEQAGEVKEFDVLLHAASNGRRILILSEDLDSKILDDIADEILEQESDIHTIRWAAVTADSVEEAAEIIFKNSDAGDVLALLDTEIP